MLNFILRRSDEKYSNYRIPGLAVTSRGTLLAYFEARRTASDWAMMDILLYRSEDGGKTFGDAVVIAEGSDEYPTVNNPVCIPDGDVLHFLYCRNYTVGGGHAFIRDSYDDGLTWSEPRDIYGFTNPDYHNAFAFGPGHGIKTSAGILAVPVWFVPKAAGAELTSHHPSETALFSSSDGGKTWEMSEIIPSSEACHSPNETVCTELSDGTVYLNIRTVNDGCRSSAVFSPDCNTVISPLAPVPSLTDPTCFGSVTRYCNAGNDALLCVHCDDKNERVNLTVHASCDNGKTWDKKLIIEPGDSGYADIAVLPDGKIAVLYEQSAGITDRLALFGFNEI